MARIFSDIIEIDQICTRTCLALITPATWKYWRKDFVAAHMLSGSRLEIGSKWQEIRKINGSEVSHSIEVTDFVANESLSLIVRADPRSNREAKAVTTSDSARKVVAFLEYRLVDYDTTTVLHLDTKLDASSLFAGLWKKSLTGAFLNLCRRDLPGLKEYLSRTGEGLWPVNTS